MQRVHVYDVACAGQAEGKRKPDSQGRVPRVPDTVDPVTAMYTNEFGSATLSAVWTDPDLDPSERAFYCVRVLEVPTPRHSLLDAVALGIDPPTRAANSRFKSAHTPRRSTTDPSSAPGRRAPRSFRPFAWDCSISTELPDVHSPRPLDGMILQRSLFGTTTILGH